MVDRITRCRIAPFGTYLFFMLLAGLLLEFGWSVDDLRWFYAVKIAAVAGLLWMFRSAYSELHRPHGIGIRTWAVAIAAGVIVLLPESTWLRAGW